MARGQDAPVRTGGQVDPYVQSSMQQNKQLSTNRLLTAMQEQGATQRTAMQERGASGRQAAQSQTQLQMQAAEMTQADKRAAEAEVARREDMKFTETQSQIMRDHQAEQAKLQRDFVTAQAEGDWAKEEKLRQMMLDAQQMQFKDNLDSTERMVNVVTSMTKGMANNEAAVQKAITLADQEEEKGKQTNEIFETRKQAILNGAKMDKALDLPILPEFERAWKPFEAVKLGANVIIDPFGLDKVLRAEDKAYANSARPKEVLQTQVNKNGSKINILDLMSTDTARFEDKIAEGKISPQDVTVTWAGLKAFEEILDEKVTSAKEGSREESWWKKERGDITVMQSTLTQVMYSDKQLKSNDKLKVGSVIRDGLASVEGFSTGSLIAKRKKFLEEAGVKDPMALYNELSKGLDPIKLYEYPEGATPYLKNLYDRRNSVLLEKYPELKGE